MRTLRQNDHCRDSAGSKVGYARNGLASYVDQQPNDLYAALMVATLDRATRAPQRRERRWRKPVALAAGTVLVASIAVGIAVANHQDSYPPIREAGFGGPYQDRDQVLAQHFTDLGTEIYLRGAVGTQLRWIFGVSNDGSSDVTVLKPEAIAPITNFQWSKQVFKEGGNAFGEDTPLQPFPATIGAHETIGVIVTIKKPPCGNYGYSNVTDSPIQWRVSGEHHSNPVTMFGGATLVPCPRFVK
jgi:hypothetical protein